MIKTFDIHRQNIYINTSLLINNFKNVLTLFFLFDNKINCVALKNILKFKLYIL